MGTSRTLTLPWRAWSQTAERNEFRFPDGWKVARLDMEGWPDGTEPDVLALTESIRELAESVETASIAIDDLTRPARLERILRAVVIGLREGGIAESRIDMVMAIGAHGRPSVEEIRRKVGDWVADRLAVRVHDANGDLADTGIQVGKTPLRIDRGFLAAQLRIGVSSIIPNPFAGFSGGAKIVLPGLASLDVLEWLHKLAMMGFAGGTGKVAGNRIREEIDRVAVELPLHFHVGCLVDESRSVRELHFGEPTESHALGCERARSVYSTPMDGSFDVLFCNAYPKDGEFLQAENGYSPLRTGGLRHLAPEGSVVLMAACQVGRGQHGLFDRGRPLHREPAGPKGYLGSAAVHVYAPGISEADCRVTHWRGYPHFQDWEELIASLLERHGADARAGVFPAGSIQLGPRGAE